MSFEWRGLLPCHSIAMSIEEACEDFLQRGDSGVFLVAVSSHVDVGNSDQVALTLLQEKYQAVLVQLGWDLLSLLTPHLSSPDSHTWRLLSRITEVCPPKEMVLALLEQMEVISATTVFLLMLQPLQKVLLQLEKETVLVSTLRSVSSLVQQHYRKLEGEEEMGKDAEEEEEIKDKEERERDEEEEEERDGNTSTGQQQSRAESSDLEPGELATSSRHSMPTSGEGNGDVREGALDCGQSQRDCGRGGSDVCQTGNPGEARQCFWDALTVHSAAAQTLEFARPFVEDIHWQYCSVNMQLLSYWTGRQRECITLLLSLLDIPLVAHNLKSGSKTPNDSRRTAKNIMGHVVKCHCGCVTLMKWEGGGVKMGRKRQKQGEDPSDQESKDDWVNEDNFAVLPPLGLACFVYLVMVEGVERSYLPAIVRQDYLLHINLPHVTTLLTRPEKAVTLKGLGLLKVLLSRVPPFSLLSYLLDNRRYLQLAELLTSLMTTCTHKSVRQQSVPLLLDLIKCFTDTGRHRIYRSLLRSVSHAGVLGLLTHNIKNEVDQALKEVPTDSLFLGPDLVPLLDLTLTISTDIDLLKESDRVMAALNFLRYLLIRDKREDNQTGVWSMLVKVREQFVTPLRGLLAATRAHCKREVEMREEAAQTGKSPLQEDGPEVTVEVGGTTLPKMTTEEEIQMLHLAQHHLDMMESVMVRVEELMNNT